MSKGFIPIRRTLFEHFLFKEHRVFSRFEAWLDLIQLASFTDDNSDLIGGKLITKNRGEIVASLRFLMKRWNWSMHKVSDFLELLRSQDMVVVDKENGISKITLTNFERHNSFQEEEEGKNSKRNSKRNTKMGHSGESPPNQGAEKGTEKGAAREHPGSSEGTNSNKDNKEKKENGLGADALTRKQLELKERKKEFGLQLKPFVDYFGRDMIRDFYNYWSEPNKSETKMKWELEQTWDLKKRLERWQSNEDKFSKKSGSRPQAPIQQMNGKKPTGIAADVRYLYDRYVEGSDIQALIKSEHFNYLQVKGCIGYGVIDQKNGVPIEKQEKDQVLKFFDAQKSREVKTQTA